MRLIDADKLKEILLNLADWANDQCHKTSENKDEWIYDGLETGFRRAVRELAKNLAGIELPQDFGNWYADDHVLVDIWECDFDDCITEEESLE